MKDSGAKPWRDYHYLRESSPDAVDEIDSPGALCTVVVIDDAVNGQRTDRGVRGASARIACTSPSRVVQRVRCAHWSGQLHT